MRYIAPRFIGEQGEKALFDQKALGPDHRFVFSVNKFIPRMNIKPVLSGNEFSVNQMNRFIWPQASWYLKQHLEFINDPANSSNQNSINFRRDELFDVIESIEYLIFFDEHPETAKECGFALECRDQIMRQYEKGEFSPEMNQLFEMVKSRGIGNTSVDDVLESIQ